MKPKLQRTFTPTPAHVERRWWVVDAEGVPLGRLATEVARLLQGKHKPTWAPHADLGDFVVVVNAAAVVVTGRKETEKVYYRHSGFPGGLRVETLARVRERHPERLVESAVRGMLPKNKLGRRMVRRLKVYGGPEHPHAAQRPEPLELGIRKVES